MRESMQVTTATPAWAMPSKPLSAKVSANRRLAASRSSKGSVTAAPYPMRAPTAPTVRPSSSTSARSPATSAHTAAPTNTVCSWARPASLSSRVYAAHCVPVGQTSAGAGRSTCTA